MFKATLKLLNWVKWGEIFSTSWKKIQVKVMVQFHILLQKNLNM